MSQTVTVANGFEKRVKGPSGKIRPAVDWAIEITGKSGGLVVVRTYFSSNPPQEAEKRALADKAVLFVQKRLAEGWLPWGDIAEVDENKG